MATTNKITSFDDLRLNVEERESVAQLAGDMIAVNVYRELQRANERMSGDSGCNIIGNCSSSCKDELISKSRLV